MLPKIKLARGFTLIELLVVIAILSILLVIVLVAINPARQTRAARNTQRRADVLTVLNAVNQYFVDNGAFPSGSPAPGDPAIPISTALGGTGAAFCNDLVAAYVAGLPADPSTGSFTDCTTHATGYTISISAANDRVTVNAPGAEGGASISATR